MTTKEYQRNIWLFSGISSGLGREWASFLLERGDQVIGITRNARLLEELVSKYKDRLVLIEVDITDMEELEQSINVVMENNEISYISHVVCAAAFAQFGTVEDVSPDDLIESFRVNVVGSRNVAIAGLRKMADSGDRRILFVSSMSGLHCWPNLGNYQISKFGVRALSDTLRKELSYQGIQVGCLYPGPHSGTGWANYYAKYTIPSSRYDADWLNKNCRCGFEIFNTEDSLPSFKQMINQNPMPSAATTHKEVAEMFEADAREIFHQIEKAGE